jgi:hypothetical protein
MTTKNFVFPDPGVPTIPIERVDLYSEQAARYVEMSRPFVAKVDWPALQWTPESLRQKIGMHTIKMFKRTGEQVPVTVSEYIDVIDNMRSGTGDYAVPGAPAISFRPPDRNPEFHVLLEDVRLPAFIKTERLHSMALWMRNEGWRDNKSHAEPNVGANLNLQIRGKKHVWLFSPEDSPYLGAASTREELMTPPYFSGTQTIYRADDEHPEFKNVRCYETVLEPGDIIHIPTLWFHWFVHYDEYQINFNTWWQLEQIPLSPISADWAYMKALCLVLGGFAAAPKRFAELPLEVQDLLTQISRTLVLERRCTMTKTPELYEGAVTMAFNSNLFNKKS